MDEQLEKIDITFKDLSAEEARMVVSYAKMHAFIHEWQYLLRDMVKHGGLEGDIYNKVEQIRDDYYRDLHDFEIAQLFD